MNSALLKQIYNIFDNLITGIVASVMIAIILIVIIVLKYIVFKLPRYKVTEDKTYQQGASAALLGNQVRDYLLFT